jgi:hypothetical protein
LFSLKPLFHCLFQVLEKFPPATASSKLGVFVHLIPTLSIIFSKNDPAPGGIVLANSGRNSNCFARYFIPDDQILFKNP